MRINPYSYFTTANNFEGGSYSSILRTPYFGEYSIWDRELKKWVYLSQSTEDKLLVQQHNVEVQFEEIQKYAPEILLKPKVGHSEVTENNHQNLTISWAEAASCLGIMGFGDKKFYKQHGAFKAFFFYGDQGSLPDLERYMASIGMGKTLRDVDSPDCGDNPKFCCSSYSQSFCMVSEQRYQITQILESRGFKFAPVSELTIWHDLKTSGKNCSLQNINEFQDCLFRLYRDSKVSLHHDEKGERLFKEALPVVKARRGRIPNAKKISPS
jgi:hypothetical protein